MIIEIKKCPFCSSTNVNWGGISVISTIGLVLLSLIFLFIPLIFFRKENTCYNCYKHWTEKKPVKLSLIISSLISTLSFLLLIYLTIMIIYVSTFKTISLSVKKMIIDKTYSEQLVPDKFHRYQRIQFRAHITYCYIIKKNIYNKTKVKYFIRPDYEHILFGSKESSKQFGSKRKQIPFVSFDLNKTEITQGDKILHYYHPINPHNIYEHPKKLGNIHLYLLIGSTIFFVLATIQIIFNIKKLRIINKNGYLLFK